jgi:hypothetical protein
MMIPRNVRFPILATFALAAACEQRGPERRAAIVCDEPAARTAVEQLGERLRQVSLLAPDSIVVGEIRRAYEPLVTPELLAAWTSNPSRAPGRDVSSPWPARIEIRSVEESGAAGCRIDGEVIYATSTDSAAASSPVTIEVRDAGGWRVSAWEAAATTPADTTPADTSATPDDGPAAATDVIRRYYAAIDAGDYARAYALWSGAGAASGQTLEEFAAGFAGIAHTEARVGTTGRIEGAAGSRFIEVPVVVLAVTDAGADQRFEGTYVLRRSVVDGASAEQRRWRIHSADISRLR